LDFALSTTVSIRKPNVKGRRERAEKPGSPAKGLRRAAGYPRTKDVIEMPLI
jgi:hypothetical protein